MASKKVNNPSQKEEQLLFDTLKRMQDMQFTQEEATDFARILKDGIEKSNNKNLFRLTTSLISENE